MPAWKGRVSLWATSCFFRHGQQRVGARRQNSATYEVLTLGCGIGLRVPIMRVAECAKQYDTVKTGGRQYNAATDVVFEGRR